MSFVNKEWVKSERKEHTVAKQPFSMVEEVQNHAHADVHVSYVPMPMLVCACASHI